MVRAFVLLLAPVVVLAGCASILSNDVWIKCPNDVEVDEGERCLNPRAEVEGAPGEHPRLACDPGTAPRQFHATPRFPPGGLSPREAAIAIFDALGADPSVSALDYGSGGSGDRSSMVFRGDGQSLSYDLIDGVSVYRWYGAPLSDVDLTDGEALLSALLARAGMPDAPVGIFGSSSSRDSVDFNLRFEGRGIQGTDGSVIPPAREGDKLVIDFHGIYDVEPDAFVIDQRTATGKAHAFASCTWAAEGVSREADEERTSVTYAIANGSLAYRVSARAAHPATPGDCTRMVDTYVVDVAAKNGAILGFDVERGGMFTPVCPASASSSQAPRAAALSNGEMPSRER